MNSVGALIEKLLESPVLSVAGVGAQIQSFASDDPLHSRYIAQVANRACNEDYETVDEVFAALQALIDRDPPILEPKRQPAADRVVLPEIKVLHIHSNRIEALVTTGPLRDREIEIRTTSSILPYLWVHAALAAYNLIPVSEREFASCPETFFVLEPMRQVNATSIARSLSCIKPQFDQLRRGKGDVTIHTLKGQLIHALFDRMLEGDADLG